MTGTAGFRSRCTNGSSSPYPRSTMAGRAPREWSCAASHAANGVFPVPPTVRFPTLTAGIAPSCAVRMPRVVERRTSRGADRVERARTEREREARDAIRRATPRTRSARSSRAQPFDGNSIEEMSAANLSVCAAASRALGASTYTGSPITDGDTREGLRDLELIPTLEAPRAARERPQRDEWRAGAMRRDERAGREAMARAPRSVRRDGNVAPRFEFAAQLQQRAVGATRRRAAHGIVSERDRARGPRSPHRHAR